MTKLAGDKSSYHHGDLKISLLCEATKMIKDQGIENLSLRKLAEAVGVSRTAAYHHFADKNDLLCAVAKQGFIDWQTEIEDIFANKSLTLKEQYSHFVYAYIQFANNNADLYELMFGGIIWKKQLANTDLKDVAYNSFNFQVSMIKHWQSLGLLAKTNNALRLAQVNWGTLHGIAKLLNDGIYQDSAAVDEMCQCVIDTFVQQIAHTD